MKKCLTTPINCLCLLVFCVIAGAVMSCGCTDHGGGNNTITIDPINGSIVDFKQQISGSISAPLAGDESIVIIVIPASDGSYWVQDPVVISDKVWSGMAQFGKTDSTDSGAKFVIYAVITKEKLQPGEIKKMPASKVSAFIRAERK
jgi:hypothetical protein